MGKIKAYHFGTVSAGKLALSNRPRFQCELNALDGQEVRLTIERKPAQRKGRSNNQNRYYRGVVCQIIGDALGYTQDEAHDIFRAKFLSEEVEREGFKFIVLRTTTRLSTIEFEEYLGKVREWASIELGIYIPLPNEASYE
jgi:hypothetical protein